MMGTLHPTQVWLSMKSRAQAMKIALQGLCWWKENGRDQWQIFGTSYPSISTEGAQQEASSGRDNGHKESRRRSWPGGNTSQGRHNQTHTCKFRKKKYYQRVVELIDVDSIQTRVKTRGWMNITQHSSVLQVLTKHAQWFHQKFSVGLKESQHLIILKYLKKFYKSTDLFLQRR